MSAEPFRRVPYADRCRKCPATVPPAARHRENGQMYCLYVCRCGYRWQCSWSIGAVEGWGDAA